MIDTIMSVDDPRVNASVVSSGFPQEEVPLECDSPEDQASRGLASNPHNLFANEGISFDEELEGEVPINKDPQPSRD